jgi:hypothetical protein
VKEPVERVVLHLAMSGEGAVAAAGVATVVFLVVYSGAMAVYSVVAEGWATTAAFKAWAAARAFASFGRGVQDHSPQLERRMNNELIHTN